MGSTATSRDPGSSIAPTKPVAVPSTSAGSRPVATPRELATQTPHVIGYELQQFVRLAGAQCRMSAAEVAYHNREHGRSRRG
jgi:hypothetical protein